METPSDHRTPPPSEQLHTIEQTVTFLRELELDGRQLAGCTQHDIDTWFAYAGAARWRAAPFLNWARYRRLLPQGSVIPSRRPSAAHTPTDAEERWRIAQKLVNTVDMDPVDRVAGALIVLYAQPLARIVTLTTSDVTITPTGALLRLGSEALELPEPFATAIQQLPHRRRASATEAIPTRWLFAGSHAARPLTATSLGNPMRAIGIQPRRFRIAAAEQLARDIPPAMLAGLLELSITAINRRTTTTQGQWANYIADRAR